MGVGTSFAVWLWQWAAACTEWDQAELHKELKYIALFSIGENIQEWSQQPTTSSFLNLKAFKRLCAEQDRFEIFGSCFCEPSAMASPIARGGHLCECFWYVWPCEAMTVKWFGMETWIDHKPPPVSIRYQLYKSIFSCRLRGPTDLHASFYECTCKRTDHHTSLPLSWLSFLPLSKISVLIL